MLTYRQQNLLRCCAAGLEQAADETQPTAIDQSWAVFEILVFEIRILNTCSI